MNCEDLYKLYPRKMGKSQGLKKCARDIKTQEDHDELKRAIKRFCQFHRDAGTEPEFLPYFSTFMSSWRDWLDEDHGSVTLGSAPTENTHQYLERIKEREVKEQEEWTTTPDPAKVREILKKAMGG